MNKKNQKFDLKVKGQIEVKVIFRHLVKNLKKSPKNKYQNFTKQIITNKQCHIHGFLNNISRLLDMQTKVM